MLIPRIRRRMIANMKAQLAEFSDAAADGGHPNIGEQIDSLLAAGISPVSIFMAIVEMIGDFMDGKEIDWPKVLEFLLRLRSSQAAAPE